MKLIFNISIAPLTVIVVFVVSQAFCQPPEIEWSRIYGSDSTDISYSVQNTTDNGYIFAGYTKISGNYDMYVVRTDSQGINQWTRTYGGSGSDVANSIQQTIDRGYIVAGVTTSYGAGSGDMYLVKTDSLGDTIWTRTYGGENLDDAECVQQTLDGGYILAGYRRPYSGGLIEMFLVKIDSIGDILWTRNYGGTDDRAAHCVRQTNDGGYIIAGDNPFYGGNEYDIYLVKTDSLGNEIWTRTYGGLDEDYALSVRQTTDGGYIIAGGTYSFGTGLADFYVIMTDSMGDTLWTRTYGGSSNDFASSVQLTVDGNYVVVGNTASFGAETGDMYLIKINSAGDILWTMIYGGPDSDVPQCIDLTNDGGYIITGCIYYWEYPANAWLVKTGPDTAVSGAPVIEWVSHPKNFILHPAYPNPFNPTTNITFHIPYATHTTLNIYNLSGQRITTLIDNRLNPGTHHVTFDGSTLSSGIYFYQLNSGSITKTQKMVLIK